VRIVETVHELGQLVKCTPKSGKEQTIDTSTQEADDDLGQTGEE
jgi:hypothetical protein